MNIKNRFTNEIIAESEESENVKQIVENNRADLRGANLYEADLREADLRGAKYGEEILLKYLTITQIGSRNDSLQIFITDKQTICSRNDSLQIFITDKQTILKTGCFSGTIEEFEKAVKNTHNENIHAENYIAAISFIKSIKN